MMTRIGLDVPMRTSVTPLSPPRPGLGTVSTGRTTVGGVSAASEGTRVFVALSMSAPMVSMAIAGTAPLDIVPMSKATTAPAAISPRIFMPATQLPLVVNRLRSEALDVPPTSQGRDAQATVLALCH